MDGHYQRTVTIFDWKIEFGMLERFETNFFKKWFKFEMPSQTGRVSYPVARGNPGFWERRK